MWIYKQSTGELFRDDQRIASGYSGAGEGKNNPAMQEIHDKGPIPAGTYEIGTPRDTETHGPHVMPLTPIAGTNTFNRDGFLIHGDSIAAPGTASHGCIILGKDIRNMISSSGDSELQVV